MKFLCAFGRKSQGRPAQRPGSLSRLGSKGRWPRFQPDVCSIMCLQPCLQIPKKVTVKWVGLMMTPFSELKRLKKVMCHSFSKLMKTLFLLWPCTDISYDLATQNGGWELSGVMAVISILIGVWISQVHAFVRIHRTKHLKPVCFSLQISVKRKK